MAGMIERGNVMDPELAIFFLSELDGMIQSDMMNHAPEEIVRYTDQEQELILRKPHDGIYLTFLTAMIRQTQGEYEGYNNAMESFNEKLETFREWYVAHYDPAETASREYMGAAPGGAGYGFAYLTAYGLAVKHGYSGTEEEWLASLEGQPGAPGAAARMRFDAERGVIQWGVGEQWYDLFTIEELKDPVVEELMQGVRELADAAADSEAAARGHAKTAAKAAEDALVLAGQANSAGQQSNKYAYEALQHRQAAEAAAGDAQVQAETAEGYAIRAEAAAKEAKDAAAGVGTGGNGSGQNVKLPVDAAGAPVYGAVGQYAVSDGAGGITWVGGAPDSGGDSGGDAGGDNAGGGDSGSTETGTVTLATAEDFTASGFYRSTGVFTDNTSYSVTDYLDIANCTSVTLTANIKTKSVSPMVWFNAEKVFISGETVDDDIYDVTVVNEYTYLVPEGASYVRCSAGANSATLTVTAERVGASDTPGADPDTPATSTEANTVYISPDGDDANTGLSSSAPVATFARAKVVGGTNGELVWLAGDYWMPSGVDLGAFAKMRTSGMARLIYYDHKFDAAELVEGYTRVYGVDCADAITGSMWQHDVADARTEIAFADRHPLHRDRTHRLPSTRIVSVTGVDTTSTDTAGYLAAMEAASDNYLYYHDAAAGKLYFTAPDADFSTHPIIKGTSNIVKGTARDVHIRGLNILYAQTKVGALSGVIEELSVLGGYGGGCIIWDGASGLELVRCEAMGADNDGINGHGSGHITCRDCWGHDNLDDGESCHEGCYITQYGGLYEHNGSGCTPATGGEGSYYSTIARNNDYTGISAQGVGAVVMCNGCLATGNQIGFNVGGNAAGMLINCVAGDNSTDFSGGRRYNCVTEAVDS